MCWISHCVWSHVHWRRGSDVAQFRFLPVVIGTCCSMGASIFLQMSTQSVGLLWLRSRQVVWGFFLFSDIQVSDDAREACAPYHSCHQHTSESNDGYSYGLGFVVCARRALHNFVPLWICTSCSRRCHTFWGSLRLHFFCGALLSLCWSHALVECSWFVSVGIASANLWKGSLSVW